MLQQIRSSIRAKVTTAVVGVLLFGFASISLVSYNRLENYYLVEREREATQQKLLLTLQFSNHRAQLKHIATSVFSTFSPDNIGEKLKELYLQLSTGIDIPIDTVFAFNHDSRLIDWFGYHKELTAEVYNWLQHSSYPSFAFCDGGACHALLRHVVSGDRSSAGRRPITLVTVVNVKLLMRSIATRKDTRLFLVGGERGDRNLMSVLKGEAAGAGELIDRFDRASHDDLSAEVRWNKRNWYLHSLPLAERKQDETPYLLIAEEITESRQYLLQTAWALAGGALLLMLASLTVIILVLRKPLWRITKTVDALPLLADARFEDFQRSLRSSRKRRSRGEDETHQLRQMAREIGHQLQSTQTQLMDRLSETEWLSLHDPLTRLANRRQFEQRLSEQLRECETLCLLYLDVDDFKLINDTSGHEAGDSALIRLSELLASHFPAPAWAARLSGDEFAVCLPEQAIDSASQLAIGLLDKARGTQITGKGRMHMLSLSIGIVSSPLHGDSLDKLLIKADMAMYRCKEQGKGQVVALTDPALEKSLHEKRRLAGQTKTAIRDNLLSLFFQPISYTHSLAVSHHEVLLRIDNADGQPVSAYGLIQAAEKSKDIRIIDEWVMNQSLSLLMTADRQGRTMRLAVNVSGVTFSDKTYMRRMLGRIEYSRCAAMLTIEITESSAMEDAQLTLEHIAKLQALGCRVALDDFGVGFSSINTLLTLPFDYVKIDGAFVRRLHQDEAIQHFFVWAEKLAKLKGFALIAEFVEDEATLKELDRLGVTLVQGYFIGKPSPVLPVQADYSSEPA